MKVEPDGPCLVSSLKHMPRIHSLAGIVHAGGTFAMYSLLCRSIGITPFGKEVELEDCDLRRYSHMPLEQSWSKVAISRTYVGPLAAANWQGRHAVIFSRCLLRVLALQLVYLAQQTLPSACSSTSCCFKFGPVQYAEVIPGPQLATCLPSVVLSTGHVKLAALPECLCNCCL